MKKFEFGLERLKDYREQILDSEKNTLGMLRREVVEFQAARENILAVIDSKSDELCAGNFSTSSDIAIIQRYIIVKRQEADDLLLKIRLKEAEIERQLQVVINATKDVSVMEKLKEHKVEEYKHLELKEEENFIEEFVQNSNFRMKAALQAYKGTRK